MRVRERVRETAAIRTVQVHVHQGVCVYNYLLPPLSTLLYACQLTVAHTVLILCVVYAGVKDPEGYLRSLSTALLSRILRPKVCALPCEHVNMCVCVSGFPV